MKNKKSFILYLDQQGLFNKLPDDIAGKLIKHIFSYVNCENPETDELIIEVAFASIKQSLKRDLNKWEAQIKQRSEAGKKSAEKRANEKQRKATGVKFVERDSTDSVNDSDSDSEVIKDLSVSDRDLKQDDIAFAEWFFTKLKEVNPKQKRPSKSAFDKWADSVRLMRVADDRTYQEMSNLFLWANSNEFWKGNIQSVQKFRKHWDMLTVQKNKDQSQPIKQTELDEVLDDKSWADNIDDII